MPKICNWRGKGGGGEGEAEQGTERDWEIKGRKRRWGRGERRS